MSRALVEDQLSFDAAGIPHLNEQSAFDATIRWGSCPQALLVSAAGSNWRQVVWASRDRPDLLQPAPE